MSALRQQRTLARLPIRTGEQRQQWAKFLQALVERYGPDGEFWQGSPYTPYLPVREWQSPDVASLYAAGGGRIVAVEEFHLLSRPVTSRNVCHRGSAHGSRRRRSSRPR